MVKMMMTLTTKQMRTLCVEVGVSADMGISIDGGEEYREGVLTITEVKI